METTHNNYAVTFLFDLSHLNIFQNITLNLRIVIVIIFIIIIVMMMMILASIKFTK